MASISSEPPRWALFRELWDDICLRTLTPARHPSFVCYFIIAILGLGALGVWFELYSLLTKPALQKDASALRTAIITFFPAVAGTATMQMVWAEGSKHFRSAAFFVFFIFSALALIIAPSQISNSSALFVGVLLSLCSLWVWWIANAKQKGFLDTPRIDDPVGGENPQAPLPGSLDDFQH